MSVGIVLLLIFGGVAAVGILSIIATRFVLSRIDKKKEQRCWECNGSGWMAGPEPCKICRGTGTIPNGQIRR